MYLHGSFLTQRKETVTVEIVTLKDRLLDIEIGRESGVLFTDDPVEIRSEVNDTFDSLFRSSATIRLYTRELLPDLFCASALDAVVNIYMDGDCIFAGYVVPQSYSQPFAKVYDELEINCIDAISAMQYFRYRDIGSFGVDYAYVKASSGMRTFRSLLEDVLASVTRDLDLGGFSRSRILYDGSVTLDTGNPVFGDLSLPELLFLGTAEDEVWTKQEVVEEIMRYLNLHLVQIGFDFFIYSLDSVKSSGDGIIWYDLDGDEIYEAWRDSVTITVSTAMDTDANLSIGAIYNRLELTCDVTEMENLVESPLDEKTLKSPYPNKQLYVKEYIIKPTGDNEAKIIIPAFKDMVEHDRLTHEHISQVPDWDPKIVDWYMQLNDSLQWRFPMHGSGQTSLYEFFCSAKQNQQKLPNYLAQNIGAALIEFGKITHEPEGKDNSLDAKVDMTKYLVVSVNGNGKDDPTEAYPTDAALLEASPVAEYTGKISGGVFSPSDSETVNYIVISGSIVLNPLLEQVFQPLMAPWITGVWPELDTNPGNSILGNPLTVPGKDCDKGRVYCTKWYAAEQPMSMPYVVPGPGLMPYTGEVPEQYEYKYSAIGESVDTVSKVGVLACMLIIGDKCVVETGTDGQVSDFEWRHYKTREECEDDDEYYAQSFTIGFDPKIGDKLIGTEFDIQNNIDYRMGLETKGTAIPVKKEDKVSGMVTFRILGPVNVVWDNLVLSRHKTWFRKAKWSNTSVPLMAHVSSIYVKDFNVTVHSDNGLINNTDNCDLVYMSDTDEQYVNVKDDLKFRITTALTKEERTALGISESLKLSSPVVVSTGEALLEVHNAVTGETGKPEQLYVDSYYREYHQPRVTLVHKLKSGVGRAGQFNTFLHPALPGKRFFVQGISRGPAKGWTEVTLKEIDTDD